MNDVKEISGVESVDRKLQHLEGRAARRVGRKVVNAGLQSYVERIRQAMQVRATQRSSGTPDNRGSTLKRLRRTVKKRNKKNRRKNIQEAKVGPGVGKQAGAPKEVDPQLLHLFLLGTDPRYIGGRVSRRGRRRTSPGRRRNYRGRMTPMDAVPRGAAAAKSESLQRMDAKLRTELEREAKR